MKIKQIIRITCLGFNKFLEARVPKGEGRKKKKAKCMLGSIIN